jgi:hypothetical protein
MPVKSVSVHSCNVKKDGCPRIAVRSGDLYIGALGVALEKQDWYYPLPKKCRCKRQVTVAEATEFVGDGRAVWILRFRRDKGRVVLNDEAVCSIWMPVERERVPRIDLISRADIERSIFGSERKSKHYQYDPSKKRFESLSQPKGMSRKDWLDDLKAEEAFERKIRREYANYIDECHRVAMEARAELMAPFRPDPFEGRCLFLFHDERTAGGHA